MMKRSDVVVEIEQEENLRRKPMNEKLINVSYPTSDVVVEIEQEENL